MPTHPASETTEHVPAAALLAITGGILDAVTYIAYGHVFANAMSGNLVFLGLEAAAGNWSQALHHIIPLCFFLIGVVAALRLRDSKLPHARLIALLVEIVTLGILGALPASFPNLILLATVSFVSAFQVTTFRHVGPFNYNSTFVTGNLREVAGGLYEAFRSPDPAIRYHSRSRARHLALICACFLLGAILGALAAVHHPTHSLWAAEPPLLTVLAILLIRPKQNQAPGTPRA
ncbi:YoaK family protein [Granulicella tundricola]|uniref:Transmembrane protein n=1 Tax=Granulicella tundricola (strain ATCC BAA-1859 / DSM 23138 / MP5ACTX9) TaxID=1198114 RepID=E8WZB3_GRATM|nr:YoaK family protein [Granulicella tundricola]ADW67715.1 protein of unknown function DUF1275 [Granulicella tundricola MP5ACTX9]